MKIINSIHSIHKIGSYAIIACALIGGSVLCQETPPHTPKKNQITTPPVTPRKTSGSTTPCTPGTPDNNGSRVPVCPPTPEKKVGKGKFSKKKNSIKLPPSADVSVRTYRSSDEDDCATPYPVALGNLRRQNLKKLVDMHKFLLDQSNDNDTGKDDDFASWFLG